MILRRKVEPVHARHLDIERDDIGIERLDLPRALDQQDSGGVTDDLDLRVLRQQLEVQQLTAIKRGSRRR